MDHIAYLQVRLLKVFRASCKAKKSKAWRLQQLKEFAEYCFVLEENTWLKRLKFQSISDPQYFIGADDDCFACNNVAEVRHHIFQLQHGGINELINIAFLCNGCHEEIHPWMKTQRFGRRFTTPAVAHGLPTR